MNAHQRRIATRQTLARFPLGSTVQMDTGKPATVAGIARNDNGRALPFALVLKRRDNRKVLHYVRTLQ